MFTSWSARWSVVLCYLALAALSSRAQAWQTRAEVATDDEVKQDAPSHPPAAAEHHDAVHDAAHGGHAAHIGEPHGKQSPEEFKTDLAIWSFVVFLLLLAVLWRFAWGPIVTGLEKREHNIAGQIAAAAKAHEDAKLMLAQYERKLAASADEVRAIMDEARRDAEHTQQEILAKARADAQAERDRTLREIETAKDGALKELGERTANLAVELAGKIVGARLNSGDHQRLIEDALTRFPTTPSKN